MLFLSYPSPSFPLFFLCLVPLLLFPPSRRFRSWSSGWHLQRTSSRSVWRTKWRSAYISRDERRPEDGGTRERLSSGVRGKGVTPTPITETCKQHSLVVVKSHLKCAILHTVLNRFPDWTLNAHWALLLKYCVWLFNKEISEVKLLIREVVLLQECWESSPFSADEGPAATSHCVSRCVSVRPRGLPVQKCRHMQETFVFAFALHYVFNSICAHKMLLFIKKHIYCKQFTKPTCPLLF